MMMMMMIMIVPMNESRRGNDNVSDDKLGARRIRQSEQKRGRGIVVVVPLHFLYVTFDMLERVI